MNSELVTQIIKLAQESKVRSTSNYVDTRQDQIIAAAALVKPEAVPLTLPTTIPLTFTEPDGAEYDMSLLLSRPSKRGAGAPTTPPNVLTITTQPSSGPANDAVFSTQPVIQLRDTNGNALPTAGITVTAALASGAGTLGGALTAVTDGTGAATFVSLKITGLVGVRMLQFTASNYTTIVSSNVTVAVGAASKASITTQPGGAVDDIAFTTQPIIQIQDISGNNRTGDTMNVVATKASGTGTIGGTTTIACSNSVATFTNLKFTGTGVHTINFTPTSLTAITSANLTVATAPPPGGLYPNLPGGLSAISDIDFSNAVPANSGPFTKLIVGGQGWLINGATNNIAAISDANDLISPSGVWEVNFAAGSYGGGIVGQGDGTGFADIGIDLYGRAPVGFKSKLYFAEDVWWDSNFEWHPISNKFFELDNEGMQLLIQSRDQNGYLRPEELVSGTVSGGNLGAFSLGVHHRLEIYLEYGAPGASLIKLWLDGTLRINNPTATLNGFASGTNHYQDLYLRNYRGGGGEIKTRASQIRYGHAHIATA